MKSYYSRSFLRTQEMLLSNIVESLIVIITLKVNEIESSQENFHLYYPNFSPSIERATRDRDLDALIRLNKQLDEVAEILLRKSQLEIAKN